ncbi:MAG: hypothetical protein MZW92_74215 [Comamonadaceae bacterium]|nr:hypothetical protein [Comamonadaceae bacterium]
MRADDFDDIIRGANLFNSAWREASPMIRGERVLLGFHGIEHVAFTPRANGIFAIVVTVVGLIATMSKNSWQADR